MLNFLRENFRHNLNLFDYSLPSKINAVGRECFALCKNLSKVDGFENIIEFSESSFEQTDLQKIVFNEKVERIPNNCFSGCKNLKTITFPQTLKFIG